MNEKIFRTTDLIFTWPSRWKAVCMLPGISSGEKAYESPLRSYESSSGTAAGMPAKIACGRDP